MFKVNGLKNLFKTEAEKNAEEWQEKIKDRIPVPAFGVRSYNANGELKTNSLSESIHYIEKKDIKPRYNHLKSLQPELEEFNANKSLILQKALQLEMKAQQDFDENNLESVAKLTSAQEGVKTLIKRYTEASWELQHLQHCLKALKSAADKLNIEL